MIIGRTNVGGGFPFKATIHVTSANPSNLVTATSLTGKSFTAMANANGECDIAVNVPATYTVSCYGRTNKTCSVADNNSTVNCSMYVYLYNNGDVCTETSGGWSGRNYTYSTMSSTNCYNDTNKMVIKGTQAGGAYGGYWGTNSNNPIDLSQYSKLHFVYTNTSGTDGAAKNCWLTSVKANYRSTGNYYSRTYLAYMPREQYEVVVDISNIDSAFIVFDVSSTSEMYIHSVWLDNI